MKKHASNPLCPVSKKFYGYISVRVRESLTLIGREDAVAEAMACIERYMADGSLPPDDSCPAVVLTFSILRPEIDKAIQRSIRARSRSAKKTSACADNQSLAASADAMTATTVHASGKNSPVFESCACVEEDREPAPFAPRNRRERRLYERDVRRAVRRIALRLPGV